MLPTCLAHYSFVILIQLKKNLVSYFWINLASLNFTIYTQIYLESYFLTLGPEPGLFSLRNWNWMWQKPLIPLDWHTLKDWSNTKTANKWEESHLDTNMLLNCKPGLILIKLTFLALPWWAFIQFYIILRFIG